MARAKLPRKQQGSAEAYHESYGSKNTEASWPHLCTCCMQQSAAQLHRELSKASCPSRPSVCGEPPRQAGPSRTGELPRRARTSSASSSSTASWTFATADEPPPEAHANLRPTSLWTPTANKNLLGKLKLRGELDLRGKPRPPPAAHPSGRVANLHSKSRPSPAAHPSGRPTRSRDLRRQLNLREERQHPGQAETSKPRPPHTKLRNPS